MEDEKETKEDDQFRDESGSGSDPPDDPTNRPSINAILDCPDVEEWIRNDDDEKKKDERPANRATQPGAVSVPVSRVSDPAINAIINTPDTDEWLNNEDKRGKAASYFGLTGNRATQPGAVSMPPPNKRDPSMNTILNTPGTEEWLGQIQDPDKAAKNRAKPKKPTSVVAVNAQRVSDPSISAILDTPDMEEWLGNQQVSGKAASYSVGHHTGKAASHYADKTIRGKKGVIGAVAVGPNNLQDHHSLAQRNKLIQQYADSNPRVCRKTLAHAYAGSSSFLPSSRSFDSASARRTSSFDAIEEIPMTSLSRNERMRQELAPGAYGGTPSTEFQRREKVPFALVGNHPIDEAHQSTATLDPSERVPANEETDLEQQQQEPADRRRSEAQKKQKMRLFAIAGVVCLLLILTATVVGVVVGMGSSDDKEEEAALVDPEQSRKIFSQQLQKVFPDPPSVLPAPTIQAIDSGKANNPQRKALEWMVADPKLEKYSVEQKRQRFALATLYFATNGPNWFDNNNNNASEISVPWLSYGRHECEWFSLAHSKDQEPCQNFTQDLREQHVDLKSLVLSGNTNNNGVNPSLKGTLPPQVGLLTNLHTLDLGFQKLRGSIPTELENLSSTLREIVLVKSFYTGTIPDSLYQFASDLQLDRNDRLDPGSIPPTVGQNSNLKYLSLAATNRQGSIPTELFQATKLETLFLNENKFTGALPTEVGLLQSSLRRVNLPSNNLAGAVPSQVGLLTRLTSLLAPGNRFDNNIPTEMGGMAALLELDLGKNRLTGSIPLQLGSLTQLSTLALKENNLKGGLPISLSFLSQLSYLDVSSNGLQGPLDPQLMAWPKLQNLRLASNQMTGSIPSQIGRLESLTELTLRSNRFDSSLPSELGLLTGLNFVQIEGTQISGQVPEELCARTLKHFSIECRHLECPADCSCVCSTSGGN